MSYPPAPSHGSLPPKPPASTKSTGFKPAFTAFAPRSVAPTTSKPPTTYATPSYSAAPQVRYQNTQSYDQQYQDQAAPTIRNPFVATAANGTAPQAPENYDPDLEAQIQQWQSAYTSKDDRSGYSKNAVPMPKSETTTQNGKEVKKTVQRSGGGSTWTDDSLLEWDPAHFRIFVGNLAGEVTDDSLLKAFAKYPSVQKARVIREKRTTKSRGYGFVSFSSGDEYFQAAKDMQGKYIGSHPVLIKRAMTEVRATNVQSRSKNKNKNKNKDKSAGGHGTHEYAGIEKKAPKTKNGLRILG